jgi:GT2 family glycosyltransferase
MSHAGPRVSVVIPTHDRLAILRRNLAALSAQAFPLDRLEVVVVADGCSDGTERALEDRAYPFPLRVLSQPSSGAGAARNRGAAEASGELLVFLDDDVIPSSGLVRAHVETHRRRPGGVVVGPSLMPPEPRPTFFGAKLRRWWEDLFRAMAQPGYEFTYRDLLGGNFSLAAELFHRVGGFDVSFRHAREDGELGARLLAAGAPFAYAADAGAEHQETADLAHCIRRWRHEGRADVRLARLHPQLRDALPLAGLSDRAVRLVYQAPRRGRLAAAGTLRLLALLERLGMRRRWARRYGQLQQYWYCRGVADELPSAGALSSFRAAAARPRDPIGAGSPARVRPGYPDEHQRERDAK